MHSAAVLTGFVVVVALSALFGGVFQPGDWYEALRKPPLTPPNWVFGPAWSFFYLCIAVAAWLVWRARRGATLPLALWVLQLVLNALWSLLFFGLHCPGIALLEIAVLLGLVGVTTFAFFRVRSLAGALLVPYAMWLGFATYLNAGVWYLNR